MYFKIYNYILSIKSIVNNVIFNAEIFCIPACFL